MRNIPEVPSFTYLRSTLRDPSQIADTDFYFFTKFQLPQKRAMRGDFRDFRKWVTSLGSWPFPGSGS